MPPMPPPGIAGADSFFGASATIASVVINRPATEAAPCSAARTTLAGSMMPAWIRSTNVVITADIPLADRALKAGAQALHPVGRPFTSANIGGALASRTTGEHLRGMGEVTRGPKAFTAADRSRFLQALDAAVVRARRG